VSGKSAAATGCLRGVYLRLRHPARWSCQPRQAGPQYV